MRLSGQAETIRSQWRLLRVAIMFYSRIPVQSIADYRAEDLSRATHFFPLVGLIVGAICAAVYLVCLSWVGQELAVILAVAAGILATGGFHEDGLADTLDAFGGGFTREQVLAIMRDSRVGTYGVLGLCLILGLRCLALIELPARAVPWAFLAVHPLSRLVPVCIIGWLDYARDDLHSKAKPVAQSLTAPQWWAAVVFAVLPAALFTPAVLWWMAVPMAGAGWFLGRYFRRRIGGYTGDCLGASQQIAEVIAYLTMVALWTCI
ncbi:MAG: adenosylcobinamide-GDP ribazoletransferase [Proteobacteria bacterium]|nr:adenosylcobinamide-GDP ribazoletransferase [Pseudomonadota bacterium]